MQRSRLVPLWASTLSSIALLHVGSICAEDNFNKRTPRDDVNQPPLIIETIVLGQSTFTVNPTNIIIEGTTIAPTLPAITVDHAAISVDKSNNVFINGTEVVTGASVPLQTSASQNSSGVSRSLGVSSRSGSSEFSGLLGSTEIPPTSLSPTKSGFHTAFSVTSYSDSGLAGSGRALTSTSPSSLPTSLGVASLSNRSSETNILSTQTGLLIPSESVSQSVLTLNPSASSIHFGTGASLSSTSGPVPGSQGDSATRSSASSSLSAQAQSGKSTLTPPAISRNATASVTTSAISSPAPGSISESPGASATSGLTGASAPSGSSTKKLGTSSTTLDVPNTTQAGGIPITSFPSSGPAASSQRSAFGGILLGFVSDGRSWVSDITQPAIKTQAINEIENLKDNTENAIKNLGGPFPPTSNTCSSGASRKRLFNPIGAVEGLADDALGLANCVDNILTDISSEIGPITGPPPPEDVVNQISTLLDALEKAGEEEEDDDDRSTTDKNSSTEKPTSTSPSTTSSKSSAVTSSRPSASSFQSSSSQSSSQTSSAASGCPSFVYPDDDIEEWEGPSLDGNLNKRALGIRGRWRRRPYQTSDENGQIEQNLDHRDTLMKRDQAAAITSINSCNFPPGQQGVQPGYSGLRGFKSLAGQPNSNGGRNGQVYNAVPKWYVGQHDCSIPNGFKWYKTSDESPTGIPPQSKQSVDHVYEKQLVNVFLQTVIDTPNFTCADMNKVFFDSCDLMQTIFDQLPGMQFSNQPANNPPLYENINTGFAGLEQSINGVKGYMFDKGIDPPSNYFQKGRISNGIQMQINTVQDFIMLFDILRDTNFANMFDVTNDRIYKAYQTVDNRITSQNYMKSDGSGPIEANFAATYKTWLPGYLADIVKPAWSWCSDTVTSIEASLSGKTDDVSNAQRKALDEIKAWSGFSQDKFTIDWSLSWSTGTVDTHAVCANPLSSTASSQSSKTTGSTSGSTKSSTVPATSASSTTHSSSSAVAQRTPTPVSTSAASPTATSTTFSCTFNANAKEPAFPCLCSDGLSYCANKGKCDWTSQPPAENCCLDCM